MHNSEQSGKLDDNAFVTQLVDQENLPVATAQRLVVFVPIAFTRAVFGSKGVRFQDTYRGTDGKSGRFDDQPLFIAALDFAKASIEAKTFGPYFLSVGGRSPEMRAINQLLQRGSQLQNIALGEIVMTWDV